MTYCAAMALWIGLLAAWFAVALLGALALGRILRGLDRPLRLTPPARPEPAPTPTWPASRAGRSPVAQGRPTPAA
jgi:hypothetical protein